MSTLPHWRVKQANKAGSLLVLLLSVGRGGTGIGLFDCACPPGFSGPDGGPCTECTPGTYVGSSLAIVTCCGNCLRCVKQHIVCSTTTKQVARLSGSLVNGSSTYLSSTGYLQVVFTSDSSVQAAGFSASWTATHSECLQCPAGKHSTSSKGTSSASLPAPMAL